MLPRNAVFFLIMLVMTIVAVFITLPAPEEGIQLQISQQRGPVVSLVQQRNNSFTEEYRTEYINFPQDNELRDGSLGLGFTQHFFIDFTTEIAVMQEGAYRFEVGSDDGFMLLIDNQEVMKHPGQRAFSKTVATKHLSEGKHTITVHYFQAAGPLGLQILYARDGTTRWYLLGEDSQYFRFS